MGHVFISYSHKDTNYAHRLADSLQNLGIDVWIDERLDYGSQWPLEIQKQLDSCDAFILIMSPRSFESDWVQSELQRAKRKLKPIFPLLLEGDEPWLSVESTQYYDVRNGELPDNRLYSTLRRVVTTSPSPVAVTGANAAVPVQNRKPQATGKLALFLVGGVGVFLALVACIAVVGSFIIRGLNPGTPSINPSVAASQTAEAISTPVNVSNDPTQSLATLVPAPTFTSLPPSGTCKDGYVYRLITPSDQVCVSPASKAQSDADNAAADSRRVKDSLVTAYGQDACAYGYIWRNLYEGDTVCVTSDRYAQYQQENADDSLYKAPGSTFCINGYVWRDAYNGDTICVIPSERDQAREDNNEAASHKAVNAYGDYDCVQGYVWREAFPADKVCVTPEIRQQVAQENAEAPVHTWP